MRKEQYYKTCDLFLDNPKEKCLKEYFNEYGYNILSNKKNVPDNFKLYSFTNQNNISKKKPKR